MAGVATSATPDVEFFHLTDGAADRDDGTLALGWWPHDGSILFALADGLGGVAGGVASRLALDALDGALGEAPAAWPMKTRLRRALQQANLAVYQKRITIPELHAMATAVTATSVLGGTLVTVHVGDCRLFLLRDGRLSQLSKDHESVQAGTSAPFERSLERAVGRELIVPIDTIRLQLAAGDVLCQCTAAVHRALGDAELGELLTAHLPPAACRALLRRARAEGAEGSLGVQVAAVATDPSTPAPTRRSWW